MKISRSAAHRRGRKSRFTNRARLRRAKLRRAAHASAQDNEQIRDIAVNIPGIVFQFKRDTDGGFCVPYISTGCLEYYGVSAEAVMSDVRELARMVHPEDREQFRIDIKRSNADLTPYLSEHRVVQADGSIRWMNVRSLPRKLPDGAVLWSGVAIDVTDRKLSEIERKKLNDQLLQSRKLETVGRLAGGIAHDFNNMLQTIMGGIQLAQLDESVGPELRTILDEVYRAAERSVEITGRLLTFARRRPTTQEVLDLNRVIDESLRLATRFLEERITIDFLPGDITPNVKADAGQIHRVVTNLVLNAKDAITARGTIRVSTKNESFKSQTGSIEPIPPGTYVGITVTDDGSGMSEEVRAHLFEPFYTTKPVGSGSGLGLSVVYGIVKQYGGYLAVESAPGKGSSFTIYLPGVEAPSQGTERDKSIVPRQRRNGKTTVLFVEDERSILEMSSRALEQSGFEVLAYGSAEQALEEMTTDRASRIDLLITDVVMPGMNGKELSDRIRELRPDIAVLFISGYTAEIVEDHGITAPNVDLLPKPFSLTRLLSKVDEMLHGARDSVN